MVSHRLFVRCFLMLCVFANTSVQAIVYGSETDVAVFPSVTFPAIDNDNTMLGFGWFKNGIILEDATTTCTFNSVYPVAGTIALNGGTLHLLQDFTFTNTASLTGGGIIYGNSRSVHMCASLESLASTYTFKDTTLILGGDIELEGQLVFDGNCYIQGNNFHLELEGGSVLVTPGSRLVFDTVDLDDIQGECIACMDDSASIVFHDTELMLTGDFAFKRGSFEITEFATFMGSYTFWYDSSQTSTISASSRWTITDEMMFKVGRKNAIDYVEPLYFVDETSVMKLDNCSLLITGSGIGLSRGKFEMDRDVAVNVLSTSTSNGLIVGTGQEIDDFSMKLNSGAAVSLLAGWWVYNNTKSTGKLHALSAASRCIRYADSKFCVLKDWTIPPMVFQVASGQPVSVFGDGVKFRFDQTKLILPVGEMEVTCQNGATGFFLTGNDSLYMSKGIEPMPLFVSGAGNQIYGTGNVVAPIYLQDSGSELGFRVQGVMDEDIFMNGGKIVLMGDLDLGLDAVLSGSGSVDLAGQSFNFSIKRGIWDSAINWLGSGIINLKGDTTLLGTWTISGDCVLDGGENVLDVSGGGHIVIESGARLWLQDINIKGISGDTLSCVDDTACLVMKGVVWDQMASYTFAKGSIEFIDENIMQGAHSFVYDSAQTSTIESHSSVAISEDMTLQIGRKNSIDSVEPLHFVDETSILQLNNCTYIITPTGMRLTGGRLDISGDVAVDILGSDSTCGLELGNGTQGNDMIYRFDASGNLKFRRGWLIYNCYSPYGFVASSENACVTRYGATGLYLKRPWIYPRMGLRVTNGSPITVVGGGALTYDDTHLTLDSVECDIDGQLVGSVQFRLAGDQSLCMTKGVFPAYIYITGTGNLIYGNGDISGPIIFQNPSAQLTTNLLGTLFFGPILNGGTLLLGGDLQLGPDVTMTTGGAVDLGYYRIILSPTACTWSQNIAWSGTSGSVNLRADVDLKSTWTFSGNCVIDGRGCVLNLGQGANIVVQDDSTLTIKNVTVKGISGSNIRCATDSAKLVLDSISMELAGDATFSNGSVKVLNNVDMIGSYSFVYDSLCTSTVGASARFSLSDGIAFVAGRHNGIEPLYFESKTTSVFNLQDCSLVSTDSGMSFLGGKLVANGDIWLNASSLSPQLGLTFGDGTSARDMALIFNAGTTVRFASGWLTYNNYEPNKFTAPSKSAQVVRYGDSKVRIQKNWLFPEMALAVNAGQPLTVMDEGKCLSYNNAHLTFEGSEFDYTGNQYGDAYFAMEGNGVMFLSKGVFPCYMWIAGSGNRLRGTGDITGPFQFADENAQLICDVNGSIMYDIDLGGGTITLANDFYLGGHTTLAQTGTVDLNYHQCFLGVEDQLWTSTLIWKNGSISLNSQVTLHGSWTFDGNCIVSGGGNMLDLDGTGEFIVADGATVALRNLRIRGISEDQIRCLGKNSRLILDNVIWEQDGDAVFARGALNLKHDIKMRGKFVLDYQSNEQCFISDCATVLFDQGFSFNYNPSLAASDRFVFENQNSKLILNSATLSSTCTNGMVLSHGFISVSTDAYFESTVADENNSAAGIYLGDGQEGHDMICQIGTGGTLHVNSGSLIYNNVDTDSLVMLNRVSRLYLHPEAVLQVNNTIDLTIGCLYMSNQARIETAPGKEIIGSVLTTE